MRTGPDTVAGRVRPVALLVHEASLAFIRPVVDHIRQELTTHAGCEPLYVECRDVSAISLPSGCLVFVLGDGFPPFVRRDGCRYVFVNFSLLRKLRWWRPLSGRAAAWIGAKRAAFASKRDLFDMVVDFNRHQARALQRERATRPVPVRHFLTGVVERPAAPAPVPLAARRWDVCFVGTDSPRRARVRTALERRGITVSPAAAADLAQVIRQSRLVANVHFEACDTLEAPRIVHALTAGAALVTERCHGLCDVAPDGCYVSVPYRLVPSAVASLLRRPDRLDALGAAARAHMTTDYAGRASRRWGAIVHEALQL